MRIIDPGGGNMTASILSKTFCVAILGLAALALADSSANGQNGAVAQTGGIVPPGDRYPDGASRPPPRYERINGVVRATVAAELSREVAGVVRPWLPAGLDLQEGVATRAGAEGVTDWRDRPPEARGIAGPALQDGGGTVKADDVSRLPGADGGAKLPRAIEPGQLTGLLKAIEASRASDKPLPARIPSASKWLVSYGLSYQGVPLSKFSNVLVILSGNGELQTLRTLGLPSRVDAAKPTVAAETAVAVGRRHAAVLAAGARDVSTPQLEVWVDGALRGRLAWSFTVTGEVRDQPTGRRYWVAATGAAELLDWEETVYAQQYGEVTGTGWEASPFRPTSSLPLEDLRVTRTLGGTGNQLTKGEDARFSFPDGPGIALLTGNLAGPASVVSDLSGAAVMDRIHTGGAIDPVRLNFGASGDIETAQVSAFHWTSYARRFASEILGPADLANLSTRVNGAPNCNAYWNGSSITFFRASSPCPNTAYSDVVLHEYGHGIDSAKGGIIDGGYSEGFGDAMATLGTRQACVGRDFFGVGTCLRPATTVVLWPCGGCGVHQKGWVYSGFTWELVNQLRRTYSAEESFALAKRLTLTPGLANPSDIPDAVRLAFLADDDDGFLGNGSPHFAELAAAADSRSIPRPPTPPLAKGMAYALADNPMGPTGGYAANPAYAFNPTGGGTTVYRFGYLYGVRFQGFGPPPSARGHAQVTARNSGDSCQALYWAASAGDFIVVVLCNDAAGNPVNSPFGVAAWL